MRTAMIPLLLMLVMGASGQTYRVVPGANGETLFSWSDDTRGSNSMEVRVRGEVTFSPEDRDVLELSRDGYLTISEGRREGSDRRLELRATRNGTIERHYFVNSRERAYEPEGKEWLATILPTVIRRSGIGADARVARILGNKGPKGILEEISLLEIDSVAAKYFRAFFSQANPAGSVLQDALIQAGQEIGSDHELARLLSSVLDRAVRDPRALSGLFRATDSIGSDHELSGVLREAIGKGLQAEGVAGALRAAVSIGSDHEVAVLLLAVDSRDLGNAAVRSAFFDAVQSIGSDHEQRQVLERIAEASNLSTETLSALLGSSWDIGSDHEAAAVLATLAERHALDGKLRDQYLDAASQIGSDHEKARVLSALNRRAR